MYLPALLRKFLDSTPECIQSQFMYAVELQYCQRIYTLFN